MTIKITTPNGGADSLDFGCAQTAIVATVTGTEVSSGEGKLEFKTTTGGTSAVKMTIDGAGLATFTGATTTAGTVTASGDLKFNSGYGSAATAYGCRAWVNFNGTGTVAIRDSGNVSSITDNGTGDYTVNFTTALVDVNYSALTGGTRDSDSAAVNFGTASFNYLVGSVRISTFRSSTQDAFDAFRVCVGILR
jgi:hypothetical protein